MIGKQTSYYENPNILRETRSGFSGIFLIETLKFDSARVDDMFLKIVHRFPISEYQRKKRTNSNRSIIATCVNLPDQEAVHDARQLLQDLGAKYPDTTAQEEASQMYGVNITPSAKDIHGDNQPL